MPAPHIRRLARHSVHICEGACASSSVFYCLDIVLSKATLSLARSLHLEGNWAINIELGIIGSIVALIAAFFAWKMQGVPARRGLYLNLLILTVGIPTAVALGIATLRVP
jgi:hypothetical protein